MNYQHRMIDQNTLVHGVPSKYKTFDLMIVRSSYSFPYSLFDCFGYKLEYFIDQLLFKGKNSAALYEIVV